jgi:hypothetical protein
LLAGTVDLGRGDQTDTSFRVDEGTAYYTLKSDTRDWFSPFFGPNSDRRTWDLRLTDRVPVRLHVSTGVGQADLNLSGANLTELKVDAGAGNVNITLPDRGSYKGEIHAGVGRVDLAIPEGLAARIEVREGLGRIDVPSAYVRNGDTYESPGYASAEKKVELRVEGGVGDITIRRTSDE